MPVYPNNSITQADMDALANLASSKLLPLVNSAIAASAWNGTWTYDDDGSGNPLLAVFSGNNVYDIPESTNIGDNSIMVPQPDYVFDLDAKNWRSELNRMRGDYFWMLKNSVTGAESIFGNSDAIVSGPWVVDVNDPDTFPRFFEADATPPTLPLNGILQGSIPPESTSTPNFCAFNNVEFWFAADDAASLSIVGTMTVAGQTVQMEPTLTQPIFGAQTLTFTLKIHSNAAGTLNIPVSFAFDLNAFAFNYSSGAPDVSDLNFSSTPAFGTLTRTGVNIIGLSSGIPNQVVVVSFAFSGTLNQTITAGDNDIAFSFDIPADLVTTAGFTAPWFLGSNGGNANVPAATFTDATLIFSDDSTLDDAQIIHPGSAGKKISVSFTGSPAFTVGNSLVSYYSIAQWKISDTAIKGVWTAKTLPTPGINVFLDQDMPPFVSSLNTSRSTPTYIVAVGTGDNTLSEITASSMRVPTTGDEDLTKFGALKSSMAARPAPYQVLRSTDFVPWDYGYPTGLSTGVNIFRAQTAAANRTLNQYGLSVPADATQVKIRLRQRGAALGWKFAAGVGTFQYGEPLPSSLKILVRKDDRPTLIDYDFQIIGNDVTIDPDGGGSYLATVLNDGFFYAVYTDGGIAVEYDLVTLIETAASPSLTIPPPRQYFPEAFECFSYCLTPESEAGLIWSWRAGSNPNFYYGKRIPQSGHCIFKVRATRLPSLNTSGIAITPAAGTLDVAVTIGQNILQPDNTLLFVPLQSAQANGGIGAGSVETGGGDDATGAGGTLPVSSVFTFLIPAGSRDSGDLSVFWPVLSGNELVYKCDEQVIVEAWVNWQPMFFNAYHARGSNGSEISYAHPVPGPIHFKSAMYFLNQFAPSAAGYPLTDTSLPFGWQKNIAQVQFPICSDIYNDLEKCLNLIP